MENTRAIASALACSVALTVAGRLGPDGAVAACVVLPLPGIVLGGFVGVSATAIWCALWTLSTLVFFGPEAALFCLLAVGLPALAAVTLLRRFERLEYVLALAVAGSTLGAALSCWAELGSWSAVGTAISASWYRVFDRSLDLYRELGISAEQVHRLEANRSEVSSLVLGSLPAITLIMSAATWLANLMLSCRWIPWPQMRDLKRWQAADWLIWVFIVSGFASFLSLESVSTVARNVFLLALACYFCQGLAIVSYFLQRLGMPRGLRVVGYLFIAVEKVVAVGVLVLGVFDFWGDFRHLGPVDAQAGSDADWD